MTERSCRKCGADLGGRRDGPGHPLLYCSTGCRRAAEYELRRAQAALSEVEAKLSRHREHVALRDGLALDCCGRGDVLARHVAFLDAERVRLEGRLHDLLDADGGES